MNTQKFYQKFNLCFLVWILSFSTFSEAAIIVTSAQAFSKALRMLTQRETITLRVGVYKGHFRIQHPVDIQCDKGAILDGMSKGSVFTVLVPNVTLQGCRIIDWGSDLTAMDAGIHVTNKAKNVRIENNSLQGDAFGIFLDATQGAKVYHNQVEGNLKLRSQDRGNGIQIYDSQGADVANNLIWHTRDGIYIDTSNGNQLRHNEIHDLRYGIHYMYSYNNLIKNNYTHHTRTGYALMQSKYLTVINNRSDGDQNYGILMNFITRSTISGNYLLNVRQGTDPVGHRLIQGAEGKALFVYNSLYNTFSNNWLENSDIGIHLTAGSEDNHFFNNRFIHNHRQVKYVSTRRQEWSYKGRGNYWSDYMGWDRNNDGIGDTYYEPNDSMDKLLWKYPAAKLLMNSPAVKLLKAIQTEFPVLKSPGVRDSYPLMSPDSPEIRVSTNTRAGTKK